MKDIYVIQETVIWQVVIYNYFSLSFTILFWAKATSKLTNYSVGAFNAFLKFHYTKANCRSLDHLTM